MMDSELSKRNGDNRVYGECVWSKQNANSTLLEKKKKKITPNTHHRVYDALSYRCVHILAFLAFLAIISVWLEKVEREKKRRRAAQQRENTAGQNLTAISSRLVTAGLMTVAGDVAIHRVRLMTWPHPARDVLGESFHRV